MLSAIAQLCLQPYDGVSSRGGQSDEREQRTRIMLEAIFTENVFEPMVLLVLSMSFILVRFSALDSSCAVVFVWVVMIINTCVLVTLLAGIFYRLVCKGKDRTISADGKSDSENGSDEERTPLLLPADGQRISLATHDDA